jgi:AraC-like DNA-binding protein
MVVLQTGAPSHRELWLDGKPVKTRPLDRGEVALHDLRHRPVFKMHSPIDSVNFYIPRQALEACADDAGARNIGDLSFTPGIGIADRVLQSLGQALLPAFEKPEEVSQLFVDNFTSTVVAHVAHSFGGMRIHERLLRGRLAPWQERRAKEFIDARLSGDISVRLLADVCRLSSSHFSRAFRKSTGMSPHQWLLFRRIDKATDLLRDRALSLATVAVACGFADQSHFNRVFTRFAGVSPGRWRALKR